MICRWLIPAAQPPCPPHARTPRSPLSTQMPQHVFPWDLSPSPSHPFHTGHQAEITPANIPALPRLTRGSQVPLFLKLQHRKGDFTNRHTSLSKQACLVQVEGNITQQTELEKSNCQLLFSKVPRMKGTLTTQVISLQLKRQSTQLQLPP